VGQFSVGGNKLPLAQSVDDYEALLHWNIALGP
jgi:hypothetical protein